MSKKISELGGKAFAVLLISLLLPLYASASTLQSDSSQIFRLNDFYIQILRFHPVARQAGLLDEKAKREIRMARGVMDPQLSSKFYEKELGGKNYFRLWDNSLKIPIWYGTDIKAGFEKNTGLHVNPENLTPANGLSYVGISVPLGQGLIIDERRAVIRQAKLMKDLAEAEQISMINKLLLQAAKDYWDWMFSYHQRKLYEEGFELADFRFKSVKERVLQGDLPPIDTVEAKMEMQNRKAMLTGAGVMHKNATLVLSNYLWTEENTPLEISGDALIPDLAAPEQAILLQDSLNTLLDAARTRHPELIKLNVKQQQLGIERRYLADNFKPKINLEYKLLQPGFPVQEESFTSAYIPGNNILGFSFNFPLFLRTERGKLQLNKIKQVEISFEQQQSAREIQNQIQAYYNDLLALQEQIHLQEEMVENALMLRNGEQRLFENGESSLFLINSREMKLISYQVKLSELKVKYAQTKAMLTWAAGVPQSIESVGNIQ